MLRFFMFSVAKITPGDTYFSKFQRALPLTILPEALPLDAARACTSLNLRVTLLAIYFDRDKCRNLVKITEINFRRNISPVRYTLTFHQILEDTKLHRHCVPAICIWY